MIDLGFHQSLFSSYAIAFAGTWFVIAASGVAIVWSKPTPWFDDWNEGLSPGARLFYAKALLVGNSVFVLVLGATPVIGFITPWFETRSRIDQESAAVDVVEQQSWDVLQRQTNIAVQNDGGSESTSAAAGDRYQRGRWWFVVTVWFALGSLSVCWGPRALLVSQRFVDYAGGEMAGGDEPFVSPTPTQRALLRRLIGSCAYDPLDRSQQITIRGEWGVGKSTVLDLLTRCVNSPDWIGDRPPSGARQPVRALLVNVNAWRLSDVHKVEQEICDEILSDWQMLRHGGWWIVPCFDSVRKSLQRWRTLRLGVMGNTLAAERDGESQIPVRRSAMIERLGHRLRQINARLVLVIDEVDRCERPLAQAVMNVAIRSLQAPGVGVVMVRVPHQMRDKALNPARESLGDIDDAAMAVLLEHFVRYHRNQGGELDGRSIIGGLAGNLLGVLNLSLQPDDSSHRSGSEKTALQKIVASRSILSQQLNLRLIQHAGELSREEWRNVAARLEERLMPGATYWLDGVGEDDIEHLLQSPHLSDVRNSIESWGLNVNDERLRKVLAATLTHFWRTSRKRRQPFTDRTDPLPVRTLRRWFAEVQRTSTGRLTEDQAVAGLIYTLWTRCRAA